MSYIDNYRSCSRTYATLVVHTGETSPEVVSLALGLQPTRTSEAQMAPRKKVNGWYLSTRDFIDSQDSRRHIDYLLEAISPVSPKLETLRDKGMSVKITCFWESATGNGGPTLSPSQMKILGDLELELEWDIWFADDEIV